MTNEEFDKRLIDRINEVLTDTGDTGADDGWLLLREKYPPKDSKKPIAWFWLGTIAAILLAGLGTGLWLNEHKNGHTNTTVVKADTTRAVNKQIQQTSPKTITDTHTLPIPQKVRDDGAAQGQAATSSKTIIRKKNTEPVALEQGNNRAVTTIDLSKPDITSAISEQNTDKQAIADQPSKISRESVLVANTAQLKVDTAKTTDAITDKKTTQIKPDKPVENKKTTLTKVGQKVVFGVYASGFYNYASGSTNQFNLGAGATMDIKMDDHFRFSTGIGVAQNTLDYYQEPTAFSFGNKNYNLNASLSSTQSPGTTTTTFKSYQTSLLALNIPIAFKYQFAKTHSYISMGFISGTYINEYYDETFVTTYNVAQSGTGQSSPPTTTEDHKITQKHFNEFDIFKTVNLSFGLGYPVSKKSVLIIEPFLNAPIGGLGYYNYAFGSWGLNLKLNFETIKK